jgi:hypothetical protein
MSEMPTVGGSIDVVVLTGARAAAWLRRIKLLPCADTPAYG